jgi:hypothetical protein
MERAGLVSPQHPKTRTWPSFDLCLGSNAGTSEIDLGGAVEGELKGLILYFTNWALTSGTSSSYLHGY